MNKNTSMSKLKYTLTFFALFLVLFLDGFGQSFIFPILTRTLSSPDTYILATHFSQHGREILYGAIVGIFFIFWMMGSAILGDLSDSYGRKKALLICILGMIAGNILTVIAFLLDNVWLIMAGRIIIGFTAGSQAIAQAAIADMSPVEHQARNTGLILLAVTLGAVLGPVYGQVFSDSEIHFLFTDQTPFIGVVLLSLMSLVILLFCYQDISEPDHKPIKISRVIDIFKDAFMDKKVKVLLLSMIGMFGCWAIYYFYMTIYLLNAFSATSWAVSIYMSMYGLGASIGLAILPSLVEKRFTTKQAVVAGWSLLAASFFLTQLSPWLTMNYVLAIFAGMGVGLGFIFTAKAFSLQVSADKQGWVMGIFNASWVGVMGIAVFFTGYIANLNAFLPFLIAYILYFIGVTLFLKNVKINN